MARAILYDGINAERYDAEVTLGEDGSVGIVPAGGEPVAVDPGELAVADEDKIKLVLSRTGFPGWRLILDQPVDSDLRAALPGAARYGRWIDRFGLAKASVALAVVAAAILFIGHVAPIWVAPLIPPSWERNVGDAMVGVVQRGTGLTQECRHIARDLDEALTGGLDRQRRARNQVRAETRHAVKAGCHDHSSTEVS